VRHSEQNSLGPPLDGSNEDVPATRHCLYVARLFCRISQGLAQFVNGGIQPLLEITERSAAPEMTLQFIAADDLSGTTDQESEDLQRFSREPLHIPELSELAGVFVELERSE
jgi:hypothetical protein